MTQSEALAILKTGANVFLTGEPGSGKTHTVNQYVAYLNSCGVEPAITASTGIAATHIGGMTVHSWCGIGVRQKLTPYDLDHIANNKRVYGRVRNARVLIIDEVSMLSAQTLSMAEAVCREVRQNREPFGGLQIILVGDFFQLPPVCRDEPRTGSPISQRENSEADSAQSEMFAASSGAADGAARFAFASSVWQKAAPLVCYLSEQHRQEDPVFLEFLSAVRRGAAEERHRALLRTRYARAPEGSTITQLYSHNADVDHINTAELSKLAGSPRAFVMEGFGPEPLIATLKRGCLSPETLSLKVGARVMFTKNDMSGRFVNGTQGSVSGFSKDSGTPLVKTRSGRTVPAEPMEWTMQDGGRVLARITQIPLRLAWAITVHKSQGMSLDAAHMDLSSAFEYGQGYVALSRVRTLKGLTLSGLNARALEVHPGVRATDERFRATSSAAREKFRAFPASALSKMHDDFIKAIGGKPGAGRIVHTKKEKVDTLSLTQALALQGRSLPEIAEERSMTLGTVIHHLEQLAAFGRIVPSRDLTHLTPDPDRFAGIEKAFRKTYNIPTSELKTAELKLAPVRALLGDSFSYDELRLARLFIKFNG